MECKKVISGTINVSNPINFCTDMVRNIKNSIETKYMGHCFKGAYILRIVSVIDHGKCHILRTNGSGHGYIDVRFIADVYIFSLWNILTGVNVVRSDQMLVGTFNRENSESQEHAMAVVSVLASKSNESISVGQTIAVRVVYVIHPPMQTHASVATTILTCDQTAPAFRLRGVLDQSAKNELIPIMTAIKAELVTRAELIKVRKADLWFFELLLYSYKAPADTEQTIDNVDATAWQGPRGLQILDVGATEINILDIVKRAINGESVSVNGIWSRSLTIYRSSPLVAVVKGEGALVPAGWKPIDGTPHAVFAEFLKNILDFLVATRELVKIYNTQELIDNHFNIWSIMRAAQS